ncbi:MAG: hypothetical protein ACK47B_28640 [Armatimonadota bacterium]
MVRNFRFEEEGRIARSAFPESEEAVDWLYDQGIRTVVSLHPIPEAAQARLRERGMEWRPFLLTDFSEELPAGLTLLLDEIARRADEAPAVLLHCQGGGGRAGTFYAAYRIRQGTPVEEAIATTTGVEREPQKAFLRGFAAGMQSGTDR